MNKNFLLITLILMVSCLGILGMVEKSEAVHYCEDSVYDCHSVSIFDTNCSAPHAPVLSTCPNAKGIGHCENGDECYYSSVGNNKCDNCKSRLNFWYCAWEQKMSKKTCSSDYKNECTDSGYKCVPDSSAPVVVPAVDCTSVIGQECLDITKCTGGVSVVTSGPRKCTSGTCCYKGTCKIASTVPQLPTNANTTSTTPASSINVQAPASTSAGSTVNLPTKKLSKILEDLIKWLLQIVILIAILMIIISGTMYMISAGDQQKADTAKKALTYAILGLLVVALAYAIVSTLVKVLAG